MSELYELPDGWEWKKLSDIGKISTGKTPPKANKEFYENGTIRFVKPPNLQNSIEITKTINDEFITEDGAKKSTLLPKNTLMVCCIGSLGKFTLSTDNVITNQQINSIVFNEKIIHFKYGYYYGFMLEKLLNAVANEAVVKIVNKSIFSNLDIPLPPFPEQQRIVSKLDLLFEKIDRSIALHQKNMDEANAFMGSVLNDVFGELEEKYEKTPLFDVADVNRGKSKHRPRNDKKLFGGKYPFIQTGDVRNANKYIDTFTETYSEFGLSQSKLWRKGTICMTIAANIGDVAILNIDSCFPDSVVGIHSENNSNDFLYYFLLTLKQQLESQATTTAQMNINLKVLQTIGVPIPPFPIQQKVVTYLDDISQKTEKIKQLQKGKMASLKALKASILDSAFRGEL